MILSERKLSNRFVMHPPSGSGCIFLYAFSADFCDQSSSDGKEGQNCIFLGALAVLH